MIPPRWITVAVLATAFTTAAAQEKYERQDPSDPSASRGPFSYQSTLENYQQVADEAESPDKGWRAANDEMKALGGHAGHIKTTSGSPSESSQGEPMPGGHGMDHGKEGKE